LAQRWTLVETDRAQEFEPLKNATGPDSPATVRQRMSDNFADWLESAGAKVVRRPDGSVPFGIEISPLFAMDAGELKGKVPAGQEVEAPLYLK
jgi:UDP-N-acetylglucosamine/UDP-N-acetylgalactosamine diphosphorylase